jgi:two-component system nitrogen regulation response regulator NtrX
VAATHRDLKEEIAEGRFREDLYYRLNVIPIATPALRERLSDVPELVDYFVGRFARENNYRVRTFTDEAMAHLQALPWRGNVRELENLIERLLILSSNDPIDVEDVVGISGGARPELSESLLESRTLRDFRELSEKLFILHKLKDNEWNVTQTAKAIETPRSNLYKKMEQYDIERE